MTEDDVLKGLDLLAEVEAHEEEGRRQRVEWARFRAEQNAAEEKREHDIATGRRPPEDALKWHVSFGQNYSDVHLDKRWHWERQGINPDEHIAGIRACGDREAKKRRLMFIGEKRIGDEIQRQYVVPTFWLRLKFLFVQPHEEVPR